MKSILLYAALLASYASAQLVIAGNGQLPECAHTCSLLLDSEDTCHGANSTSLAAWSCFCQTVYTGAAGDINAICSTCSGTDATAVGTWFTNNCGEDNGASEHDESGSPTTTAVSGAASGSAAAAGHLASSSATASGVPADSGNNSGDCGGSWWSCHYQWIIMIIVVAVGLVALGFGGRWLKKRHDIRRDQMRSAFNAGVTSQPGNINDEKAFAAGGAGASRDSPARNRNNFMPYGYGYSRSGADVSEFSRGASPVEELEKGDGPFQASSSKIGAREKLRRVMVRDTSK